VRNPIPPRTRKLFSFFRIARHPLSSTHFHNFIISRYYKNKKNKIFSLFLQYPYSKDRTRDQQNNDFFVWWNQFQHYLILHLRFIPTGKPSWLKALRHALLPNSSNCMSPPTKCLTVDETPLMDRSITCNYDWQHHRSFHFSNRSFHTPTPCSRRLAHYPLCTHQL